MKCVNGLVRPHCTKIIFAANPYQLKLQGVHGHAQVAIALRRLVSSDQSSLCTLQTLLISVEGKT